MMDIRTEKHLAAWENANNQFGNWVTHGLYRLEDWQFEVNNDHTRQGYYDWVRHCIMNEAEEEMQNDQE